MIPKLTKYFLVYIRILRFDELAEKEENTSILSSATFKERYEIKVERVIKKLRLKSVHYPDSPEWLLFAKDKWVAFRAIEEVLKTGLEFEIAVGIEYFKESLTAGENREYTNETMSFLNNDILSPYGEWYKENYKKVNKILYKNRHYVRHHYKKYHKSREIKETFIVATEYLYSELDFEKTICRKIVQAGKTFYGVDLGGLKRRLNAWEFQTKTSLPDHKRYRTIDELYIEPKNYEEICTRLDKNNIVLLIGDTEMGKTYTAIKLLFDLYKKGWETIFYPAGWIKTNPEIIIEGIEELIRGKKAIYFEDPFGIEEFTSHAKLSGAIEDLVCSANQGDCKIIITSRPEVFKKFKEYRHPSETLLGYISKFKVGLTYEKGDIKDMVDKYLDVFKPMWSTNNILKNDVFSAIDNEQLKTPMGVKKLVSKTLNVSGSNELRGRIEYASEETPKSFAEAIRGMLDYASHDEIVFLSFAYINVDLAVAEKCYEPILSSLRSNTFLSSAGDYKKFDKVRGWFDEEVETIKYPNESAKYLIFSHSTYAEAFQNSLNYKNVVMIFETVLTTILDSTDDKETIFTILEILDRDPIRTDIFFDLIDKLLLKEGYEINNLALKTLLEKRELGIGKTFKILERTINKSKESAVVTTALSFLPKLIPEKTDEVFSIYESIVKAGKTEFFRTICSALINIGIRNEKTTDILKNISNCDYGETLSDAKETASKLLIDWNVTEETTDSNLLENLRDMDSDQTIDYINELMIGSGKFNRCNLSIHFFGFVLEYTYKNNPKDSFLLMEQLIEKSSNLVRPSWIVARSLCSDGRLDYNNVKNLVESKKYILCFTGFIAILQLYTWLDHFRRKYEITNDSFNKLYDEVKEQSIELLTILQIDTNEFLRAVATMFLEEIQNPSEDITLSTINRIINRIVKRIMLSRIGVKVVGRVLLFRVGAKALDILTFFRSMNDLQKEQHGSEQWGSILFILPLTRLDPKRTSSVFEVFSFNNKLIMKTIMETAEVIAYEFRKNPKNIFEIAKKYGRDHEDYSIRNIFIDITPFFGATIPNETLDELESLLSDSKYDDIDSKIVLTSSLHVMKQMFGLIVDFIPDSNSEPKNVIERIDGLLSRLMEDPSHEVSILAEIARDGIQFKN